MKEKTDADCFRCFTSWPSELWHRAIGTCLPSFRRNRTPTSSS